jgi:hypothetical protein
MTSFGKMSSLFIQSALLQGAFNEGLISIVDVVYYFNYYIAIIGYDRTISTLSEDQCFPVMQHAAKYSTLLSQV